MVSLNSAAAIRRSAALAKAVTRLEEQTSSRIRAEQALASALARVEQRESALRAAEQLAQLGSWSWDIGDGSVSWSDQVHHIFGTDASGPGPAYETYVEMLHPDDREHVLAVIRSALQEGTSYQVEHRIVRTDGQVREIRGRGRVEFDLDGAPARLTGSLQDVTAARASAQELQRSRDPFSGVLDAATEQSIIATDADGLITVFNTGAERMLGYKAADMIGTSPERLHDRGEIEARARELQIAPGFQVFLALAGRGHPETRQWTYVTRDGRRLRASITVTAMHDPAGEITGYINVGTDITAALQAEAALQHSELRFRDTFQYAPTGMMLIAVGGDESGRILQVNPALCQITGYSEDQLVTMRIADLTAPDDLHAHQQRFAALSEGRPTPVAVERHWIHADGHDLWVQFNVTPRTIRTDSYVVGQADDISARKHAEARLTHQALHDALTGLPNRLLLMDRIQHALAASTRSHGNVGILYMDLDGFKAVNDTAGHAAGDDVLVQVAERIRRAIRPGDTVARLGGDEFVVVCEGLDDVAAARHIADRIVAAMCVRFVVGEHSFALSASIGVLLSNIDSDPEEVLKDADHAMYRAKQASRTRSGQGQVAAPR